MIVFLSNAELAELCRPLKQPAAQIRYLQQIGVRVRRRPDGTPLVLKSDLAAGLWVARGAAVGRSAVDAMKTAAHLVPEPRRTHRPDPAHAPQRTAPGARRARSLVPAEAGR